VLFFGAELTLQVTYVLMVLCLEVKGTGKTEVLFKAIV